MQDSRARTSARCCDNGQPIAIDPSTGTAVCSCQIQTGVPAYLSRVPRLPENFYGSVASNNGNTDALTAFYPTYHADRLVDSRPRHPGMTSSPSYIGHAMAAHPYGAFYPDFDLLGARRKNATRETTGPLKSWLYQHRKNPYPTKAEKVMLAIVTQMTLTQVSTWFANARRRLKKENKLGKDLDLSDIDVEDKAENDALKLNMSTDSSNSDASSNGNRSRLCSEISDISDAEDRTSPNELNKKCVKHLFTPDGRDELFLDRMPSPEFVKQSSNGNVCNDSDRKVVETLDRLLPLGQQAVTKPTQVKPKIWSISDIIS